MSWKEVNKDLERMEEEVKRMEEKDEPQSTDGRKTFNESRNIFKPPGATNTKIALSKDLQLLDEIRNFDRERGLRRTKAGEENIEPGAKSSSEISTVLEIHQDEDTSNPRKGWPETPVIWLEKEVKPETKRKIGRILKPWSRTDPKSDTVPKPMEWKNTEPLSRTDRTPEPSSSIEDKERRISQSSLGVGETRFIQCENCYN